MGEANRAEVVRILQLSVVTAGPVKEGQPESLVITGVVDPRMLGTTGSKGATTPTYRDAQYQSGVAGSSTSRTTSRSSS